MAKDEDRRLTDLERKTGGDDEIEIVVNWDEPGMIRDDDGELITVEAWKKKYPERKLKIVDISDCWD